MSIIIHWPITLINPSVDAIRAASTDPNRDPAVRNLLASIVRCHERSVEAGMDRWQDVRDLETTLGVILQKGERESMLVRIAEETLSQYADRGITPDENGAER